VFLCGTDFQHITSNGKTYYPVCLPSSSADIYKDMLYRANIHTPTIIFRNTGKSFFDLRYPKYNDAYTFFKLLGQGKKFANIPLVLFDYRIHTNNYNHSQLKKLYKFYVNAKYEAILRLKYKARWIDVVKSLIQFIAVLLLPEQIILRFHPAFKVLAEGSQ
jgi:hypothetical protein